MRAAATFYELMLGVSLLLIPWSPIWIENWFLWHAGPLRPWLLSPSVKGAVSGFGAGLLLSAVSRALRVPLADGMAEPLDGGSA